DDRNYTDVMVPMGTNPDDWAAAVASYVRTSFGNASVLVSPAALTRVRRPPASRKALWSIPELEASLPKVLLPDPAGKLSASHNPAGVAGAPPPPSPGSPAPR